MRKMILILVLLMVALPAISWAGEVNFIGRWSALSEYDRLYNGDMEVFNNQIVWEKHGAIQFKVIEKKSDALILEIEREIDCGRYIRIGPLEDNELEVAFYKSLDEALTPKRKWPYSPNKEVYSSGCSWGIYIGPQAKYIGWTASFA